MRWIDRSPLFQLLDLFGMIGSAVRRNYLHVPATVRYQLTGFLDCARASMSASLIGRLGSSAFRLSTTAMSMSLAGSCFSSESAQGPSIMGFEDEVEQSFSRPCRQSNSRTKRTHELTSSIVPRGTSFHRSVDLDFLLSGLILNGFHAAAAACSRVHRNSVPSTHIRCMITASRRARATIAFFIPRRLAICMAQALSHDHFFERIMLCAAS